MNKIEVQNAFNELDSLTWIDQSQAVELARENFPLLQNKRLEIEQQQTLKKTAWDLGTTEVFTGGEEIDNGRGIYTTIGVGQKDIDIFGIAPQLRVQKQQIALAEKAFELSTLQVTQEVKTAWAEAFVAKRRFKAFTRLDSVYQGFERAVTLRYEVEAISRLQLLSASNQAAQIQIQQQQAQSDYLSALERLNLWLGGEIFYTVPEELETDLLGAELLLKQGLQNHPALQLSRQQADLAQAEYKVARADFLPKLNLEGGMQEVNGNSGFYSYQAGISIPILSGRTYGKAKAAKIEIAIAEQSARYREAELQAGYRQALQEYQKWKRSWQFYKDEALPLAEKQQKGALLALNEGAVEYVAFIQMLDEVVQVELNALDALENYLQALADLQFYLNTKSN